MEEGVQLPGVEALPIIAYTGRLRQKGVYLFQASGIGKGRNFTTVEPLHNGHIPRGGDSHMKQTGMLVVSLRGVNFGFWSRLGCSEQSANILSRQGLV